MEPLNFLCFSIFEFSSRCKSHIHTYSFFTFLSCLKSVQIRSYFWSIFSCIQSKYRKIWTRNNYIFGQFSLSDIFIVPKKKEININTNMQKYEIFRLIINYYCLWNILKVAYFDGRHFVTNSFLLLRHLSYSNAFKM